MSTSSAAAHVLRGKLGALVLFVVAWIVSVCLWAGYLVGLMSQHRRLPVIAIMGMVDRAVGLLLSLADL